MSVKRVIDVIGRGHLSGNANPALLLSQLLEEYKAEAKKAWEESKDAAPSPSAEREQRIIAVCRGCLEALAPKFASVPVLPELPSVGPMPAAVANPAAAAASSEEGKEVKDLAKAEILPEAFHRVFVNFIQQCQAAGFDETSPLAPYLAGFLTRYSLFANCFPSEMLMKLGFESDALKALGIQTDDLFSAMLQRARQRLKPADAKEPAPEIKDDIAGEVMPGDLCEFFARHFNHLNPEQEQQARAFLLACSIDSNDDLKVKAGQALLMILSHGEEQRAVVLNTLLRQLHLGNFVVEDIFASLVPHLKPHEKQRVLAVLLEIVASNATGSKEESVKKRACRLLVKLRPHLEKDEEKEQEQVLSALLKVIVSVESREAVRFQASAEVINMMEKLEKDERDHIVSTLLAQLSVVGVGKAVNFPPSMSHLLAKQVSFLDKPGIMQVAELSLALLNDAKVDESSRLEVCRVLGTIALHLEELRTRVLPIFLGELSRIKPGRGFIVCHGLGALMPTLVGDERTMAFNAILSRWNESERCRDSISTALGMIAPHLIEDEAVQVLNALLEWLATAATFGHVRPAVCKIVGQLIPRLGGSERVQALDALFSECSHTMGPARIAASEALGQLIPQLEGDERARALHFLLEQLTTDYEAANKAVAELIPQLEGNERARFLETFLQQLAAAGPDLNTRIHPYSMLSWLIPQLAGHEKTRVLQVLLASVGDSRENIIRGVLYSLANLLPQLGPGEKWQAALGLVRGLRELPSMWEAVGEIFRTWENSLDYPGRVALATQLAAEFNQASRPDAKVALLSHLFLLRQMDYEVSVEAGVSPYLDPPLPDCVYNYLGL